MERRNIGKYNRDEYFGIFLSFAAGIAYALWLLGYRLNPRAMDSLDVSVLQAKYQPHYVFFIGGDIVTGILSVLLCIQIFRITDFFKHKDKNVILICAGVSLFGIMTATSALLPSCTASSKFCLTNASQVLDPHDLTSAVAAIALSAGMLGLVLMSRRIFTRSLSIALTILLTSYCLGGLSFIFVSISAQDNMLLVQHVWLIISSICLWSFALLFSNKVVTWN